MKRDALIEGEVYCYTRYRSRHRSLADVYSPEPWTFVGIDSDGDLRFAQNDPETLVVSAKIANFGARSVVGTWAEYVAAKAVADVQRKVRNANDKAAKTATEALMADVAGALGVSAVRIGYAPRRDMRETTLLDSNQVTIPLPTLADLLAKGDSPLDVRARLRAIQTIWTDEDAKIEAEKARLTGAPVPVV